MQVLRRLGGLSPPKPPPPQTPLMDIRQYVKTCHLCQVTKPKDVRDRAQLEEIETINSLPFFLRW